MFGLEVVDVAIGLTLLYLLLASITSAIRERWEAFTKMRAVDLEKGISQLLDDSDRTFTKAIYDHPMVNGLFAGAYELSKVSLGQKVEQYKCRSTLPSYIPSSNFALALLDIVARGGPDGRGDLSAAGHPVVSLEDLRQTTSRITNTSIRSAVILAIDAAQGDINKAQTNIEAWFNAGMERVSGAYRRRSQTIVLFVGAVLTVALNVNTLTIVQRLSTDAAVRQSLVERANQTASQAADEATAGKNALNTLSTLRLPIGWDDGWPGPQANPITPRPQFNSDYFKANPRSSLWVFLVQPILGWLLTAFAVSMGAPFWFDTLNKLTSLRSTLKPKDISGGTPAAPVPTTTIVQVPSGTPAPEPAVAEFKPHEWASGNPQEGVL